MSAGLKPPVRAIAREDASAKPSFLSVSRVASMMRRRVAAPPGLPGFLTTWFDQSLNQEYSDRMVRTATDDKRLFWLVAQRWENVLFAHWSIDPREIAR